MAMITGRVSDQEKNWLQYMADFYVFRLEWLSWFEVNYRILLSGSNGYLNFGNQTFPCSLRFC